jgi:integral membrane protein
MIFFFRILGWLEGASFLLLLGVAMPLKYLAGDPSWVRAVGSAHGGLFMAYLLVSWFVGDELQWTARVRLKALLASVLPFGTFVFERTTLPRRSSG